MSRIEQNLLASSLWMKPSRVVRSKGREAFETELSEILDFRGFKCLWCFEDIYEKRVPRQKNDRFRWTLFGWG